MKWIPVSQQRPSDGQCVDLITPTGAEINNVKYVSGLWYVPDTHKTYLDKPPVFWKPTAPVAPVAKPARNEEGTRA